MATQLFTGARTVRLIDKRPETSSVTTYRFARGDPPLEWKAGQNLVMTIPGVEDPRGATRPFTISSSPTETGFLAVTTTTRPSPFKQRLASLAPGDTVQLEGPEGAFMLEPGRPALFIAGGVGVTPFRSMLRFATDTRLEKPLVLVCSSKTPEDIVFRKELDELASRNHAIRILHTITRPAESRERWTGPTGHATVELFREALRGVRHPLVYFAGPPGLIQADRATLLGGIHLSDGDLRVDEFEGY